MCNTHVCTSVVKVTHQKWKVMKSCTLRQYIVCNDLMLVSKVKGTEFEGNGILHVCTHLCLDSLIYWRVLKQLNKISRTVWHMSMTCYMTHFWPKVKVILTEMGGSTGEGALSWMKYCLEGHLRSSFTMKAESLPMT